MFAFIARRIAVPTTIKDFGNIYVFLRYLGTSYLNGEYEYYFARLRATLITGTKEKINTTILEEAFRVSAWKTTFTLAELVQALCSGIDANDPLRLEKLAFVSSVTKQYNILYATIEKADFPRDKEFPLIYGNFARQSTDSKEKRQRLMAIRDKAVEVMTEQIKGTMESQPSEELKSLYQKNLLFVTGYEMSDYILEEVLEKMDFRMRIIFKTFYQNLTKIDNADIHQQDERKRQELKREIQRQRVIEWIKTSNDTAFIRMTLSVAFTYEISPEILDDILSFLDTREDRNPNADKIILKIPFCSFNYENYEEHKKRRAGITEEKKSPIPVGTAKEDKKKYEALADSIKDEGCKTVVFTAYSKNSFPQLVNDILGAVLFGLITHEDTENLQREIAKFDWQTSQRISQKDIRGICSADIFKEETPLQVTEFNEIAHKINTQIEKKHG